MRFDPVKGTKELSIFYNNARGSLAPSIEPSTLHSRPGLTHPGDRGQNHSASERPAMTREYPRNIGILAAELYFPSTFVSQADLGM